MSRTNAQTRFDEEHVAGCLLGGAVGDALGAPVEFMSLKQIRQRYGLRGIADPPVTGGVSLITDDTQMTLFTAEGLLRAISRWQERGICSGAAVIHHAYLRWLHTQGGTVASNVLNGWLIERKGLFDQRAPGNTCLSALASGQMGTIENPINDSKGCGGVMRVAPIGLSPCVPDPFKTAAEAAAITHGHPSGYLAAGALGAIIRGIMQGMETAEAIEMAIDTLRRYRGHDETVAALRRAIELAKDRSPSSETVESLGGGWVAEEALAIAVYCVLAYPRDLPAALRLAANHSGDSDSTAAIAGNILGARLGRSAIPSAWLKHLELRDEIETLAADLVSGPKQTAAWARRYPPF